MILGRPDINKDLGVKKFTEFFYSKDELEQFCKENGLLSTGTKDELRDRIISFIDPKNNDSSGFVELETVDKDTITEASIIEPNFQYNDKHQSFFIGKIGIEYIPYEDFKIWLEESPGKTYRDAINFWYIFHQEMIT